MFTFILFCSIYAIIVYTCILSHEYSTELMYVRSLKFLSNIVPDNHMCMYVIKKGENKFPMDCVTYILDKTNVRCCNQKLLISIPFRNVNGNRVKLQSLNNVQKINVQLLIRRLNSTLYLYM